MRQIHARLEYAGLEIKESVDPANAEGAAQITRADPDGGPILIGRFRESVRPLRASGRP